MKKILFLLSSIVLIMCLSSCTTQSYIGSFSRFVDKTDANCHNYSLKKWKRSVGKFKDYSITRFYKEKSNLSADQVKEVLRLDARYLVIAGSQGVVQVKGVVDEIKSLGPEVLGGFLDEFLKRTGKKR